MLYFVNIFIIVCFCLVSAVILKQERCI